MSAPPWSKQEDPTTGRHLFCPKCQDFQQHAVTLTKDGNRKIKCQACGEVQAILQPYGNMWIEEKFAERPSLIATFLLGRQEIVRALMPKGEKEEPEPKKEKTAKPKKVAKSKVRKRSNLTKALALPAIGLGGLHLALLVLAVQFQMFLWPFTLVSSAFAFDAETATLAGILASTVAIALGILGLVLRKRGEKA